MKRNSLLILSALAILVASCGNKGGKSGLLVPKDASMVVHINSSSLSSKLTWEEIRQSNWFKEMSQKATDSTAQQLLQDPASSGIDTKADLVLYVRKAGAGNYMVFEGSLTDASKFEKLLLEVHKEKPKEVKKDGDLNYMSSEDDGVILWNKSRFALISNSDVPDMNSMGKNQGNQLKFSADSLRAFGREALDLKSENNLDTDKRFADLVKDGSDIHFWINSSGYGNQGGITSMMNLKVLFDGNVSAVSLNFDNGKITGKSKTYYNDEMSKLLDKHKPENISSALLNRIPSSNVAGVLAFNYPPQGLQEFLKVLGVDGMANGFLADMNYSIEEFVKANKGEVLFAVSDINMQPKVDTIRTGGGGMTMNNNYSPNMNFLFATSVNDAASFQKLVTILEGVSKNMMQGKVPPISYEIQNGWFAASNDAAHKASFLAGTGGGKQAFVDKISGHPMGMYIDLNKIITATGSKTVTDSSAKRAYDLSLATWQDIVGYGGEYKDKVVVFDFEVNFVDKNTNSLKQMNRYFDNIYVIQQEKKKNMANYNNSEWDMIDTTVAPPPPVGTR